MILVEGAVAALPDHLGRGDRAGGGWEAARRAGPPPGGRGPRRLRRGGLGSEEPKAALFHSVDPARRRLTGRALERPVVLAMIKRRAAAAEAAALDVLPHVPRDGDLGVPVQRGHAHASPKTTKLHDRTTDTVTVDEIERIVI